jgi:hypothetical protein
MVRKHRLQPLSDQGSLSNQFNAVGVVEQDIAGLSKWRIL